MGTPETGRTGAFVVASEQDLADRLCQLVGLGLAGAASIACLTSLFLLREPLAAGIAATGVANSLAMWRTGAARRGAERAVIHLAVYGVLASAFYAALPAGVVALTLPAILVVVAALVHGTVDTRRLIGLLIVLHLAGSGARIALQALPLHEAALTTVIPPLMLALLGTIVLLLVERQEARRLELHLRLLEIEAVIPAVDGLARGDLTLEVAGEGPLADATRRTGRELSALARQLRDSVAVVRRVAGVIDRTALEQAQGTLQLAAAAREIHDAQNRLLRQARDVAGIAEEVAQAARASKRATDESSERLAALARTASKVTEHHAAIRKIAAKSEVLAVNAAIEAVHAGEAGRAFSAVAARLQALAEAVREQLATAEALNEELQAAARSAIGAADRSTAATEQSAGAATRIADTAADQLASTERFGSALAEIEAFAGQLQDQTEAGRSHADQLVSVATRLTGEVDRFRTAPERSDA